MAAGDLSLVNAWNREHIWQYGKLYPTQKILRDALMQLHHEDDSPENDTLKKEDEHHVE